MPDRYPPDSVLVPQWTRVVDGLPPEKEQKVTFVCRSESGIVWTKHGVFRDGSFCDVCGPIPIRSVTHWSPRVGIPLPEEE